MSASIHYLSMNGTRTESVRTSFLCLWDDPRTRSLVDGLVSQGSNEFETQEDVEADSIESIYPPILPEEPRLAS